jgi:hypothetical protein
VARPLVVGAEAVRQELEAVRQELEAVRQAVELTVLEVVAAPVLLCQVQEVMVSKEAKLLTARDMVEQRENIKEQVLVQEVELMVLEVAAGLVQEQEMGQVVVDN